MEPIVWSVDLWGKFLTFAIESNTVQAFDRRQLASRKQENILEFGNEISEKSRQAGSAGQIWAGDRIRGHVRAALVQVRVLRSE